MIAGVLRGAWRQTPPEPTFSEQELASVEPPLMASGAAGLVWHRIAGSPLASTPIGERFAEAHRLHVLRSAVRTRYLEEILALLADEGITPLIFKGWDSARRYPDTGMRPYGDIDLLVRPSEESVARRVIATTPPEVRVDLDHPKEVMGSSVAALIDRAHAVDVGGHDVLVPSEEDRLRMLAIHFLKSGGWRPSNLCDLAMAAESLDGGFSLGLCRSADRAVSSWVGVAFDLAATLLGAHVPPELRDPTPSWASGTVIRAWGVAFPTRWRRLEQLPSARHPRAVAAGLARRWPNPLAATVAVHEPVRASAPTPAQVRWLAQRSARYVRTQGGRRSP